MEKKRFPGRREFLKLTFGAMAALLVNACQPQKVVLPTLAPSPAFTVTPTPVPSATSTIIPTPALSATNTITPPPAPTSQPVAISGTEKWQINSKAVDQEYQIFIALPAGYNSSDKIYPVLYLLDANGSFVMATGIVRIMQYAQEIPEFIMVGIGYPDEFSSQISNLRARDFIPTHVDPPSALTPSDSFPAMSGGAANFLKFIREELKPVIDAKYRTDPADAGLHGHSFGGLFSLYALLHHDGTFKRYMASSASIWWDDRVIMQDEQDYAAKNSALVARVFMSAGMSEGFMVTDMQEMATKIESRNYPGLFLKTFVFDGETHISVIPAAFSKGLRSVYS